MLRVSGLTCAARRIRFSYTERRGEMARAFSELEALRRPEVRTTVVTYAGILAAVVLGAMVAIASLSSAAAAVLAYVDHSLPR
jgi:hypothetical protein